MHFIFHRITARTRAQTKDPQQAYKTQSGWWITQSPATMVKCVQKGSPSYYTQSIVTKAPSLLKESLSCAPPHVVECRPTLAWANTYSCCNPLVPRWVRGFWYFSWKSVLVLGTVFPAPHVSSRLVKAKRRLCFCCWHSKSIIAKLLWWISEFSELIVTSSKATSTYANPIFLPF